MIRMATASVIPIGNFKIFKEIYKGMAKGVSKEYVKRVVDGIPNLITCDL